jgi:hypothetical protein
MFELLCHHTFLTQILRWRRFLDLLLFVLVALQMLLFAFAAW